jgi:ABC-type polysaccharide/polyol phosphate export permease
MEAGMKILAVNIRGKARSLVTRRVKILIFLSPVCYPMETLPKSMRYYLFPPTYAADGIAKGLSGKNGIGTDILVLMLMAFITLVVAIRCVRGRET